MQQSALDNVTVSTEEVLGPPKVDMIGFSLISLLSLVTGFIVGIIVFLLSYVFLGNFSLQTGASPIILAMIAAFGTVLGNIILTYGLCNIFPHIFRGSKTLYVQVTLFSVVLYICMSFVYFTIDMLPFEPGAILGVYVAHIIFDVFGVVLITGLLSIYRYSILVFYASVASLIFSAIIPVFAYSYLTTSTNTLFIFMAFSALVFFVTTTIAYALLALYYRIYTTSGYDPLGNTFSRIIEEERELEKTAENALFQ